MILRYYILQLYFSVTNTENKVLPFIYSNHDIVKLISRNINYTIYIVNKYITAWVHISDILHLSFPFEFGNLYKLYFAILFIISNSDEATPMPFILS